VDVTPHTLAQFVAWLADEHKQGKRLGDATIRNIMIPVRAALATAQREGLIRHNPATGLALPHRPAAHDEAMDDVKALSRDQLAALIMMVPTSSRLLVEVIASTGLRISEAIALQRADLMLHGERPSLRVRRAIVKGTVCAPKSKYGRRTVLIPLGLADRLSDHIARLDPRHDRLLFTSQRGTPLDLDNLRKRMLKPLMEEIGASWAAWHTLRHTYASVQLANGVSVVALSRALGHHSAAFTLSRYVHVLEGDEAPPLELATPPKPWSTDARLADRTGDPMRRAEFDRPGFSPST
jgi:integrase